MGGSERSARLKAVVPDVAEEFRFKDKFGGREVPDLPYVVLPDDAPEEMRAMFSGSGALMPLPGVDKHVIIIRESSYENIVDERNPRARAFLAHEIGHSMENLTIGEGPQPLGHLFNELYAEWVGDYQNSYYAEKHMTNLLAASGFDVRNSYLPRLASGEMSMPDFIGVLRDQFGNRNALRLLAYTPADYDVPGQERPADIVQDCIQYVLEQGRVSPRQVDMMLQRKYAPGTAAIMLTNTDIRPIVPPVLYQSLLAHAKRAPGFDESQVIPIVPT